MANPTPYDVAYSFAGWQTTNPSKPLPADELDAELANIETSSDSTIAALATIRRSDGYLANKIVGWDQLDDQLKLYLTRNDALVPGEPGSGSGSDTSGDIRPEDFDLGSDEANIAAAFAQGIALGTPVSLDGYYPISTAIPTVEMTAMDRLTVRGHGRIKCVTDLGVAVSFNASHSAPISVSAVLETTRAFPGDSTSACDCTRITAAGHGASIGEILKIVSDDQTAPQSVVNHRQGEFVYAADVSGDYIYVAGHLLETYTTNVRIVRVQRDAKLIWDGPTFEAAVGHPTWSINFLRVRGFVHPVVRTGCSDGYDVGLDISSCLMAEVDVHGVQMVNRAASGGSVGYLVQDSASAFSVMNVRGIDARHAYTSVTPTSAADGQAYLYGRTYGSVIEGVGMGCSAAAFDTHTDSTDITFEGLSTGSTRFGESAAGAGIQLRGIRNKANNCRDRGSVHGAMFYTQVSGDCVDCELVNFDYVGTGDGVRINNGTTLNATNPKVRGGLIRSSGARSIAVWDCGGGLIEDVTIAPTGSGSGDTGILLGGDANILVRRVTFDLRNYGGTNFRAFGFDAAASGNYLRVEDCRVINASGKFQAWFSAANNNGSAEFSGLRADALPTSGNFINTGSLAALRFYDSWALIGSYDFAVSGAVAQFDVTDLAFDDIMVVAKGVTKASTGTLDIRVSTNNGSTYKASSGDYVALAATGVESNLTSVPLHTTNATAARSGVAMLTGLLNGQAKVINVPATGVCNTVPSGSVINGIRVLPSGGGNITGGTIQIFGR